MPNSSLSQMVSNELYVSHSQISCWTQCSMRYELQYVRQLPPERVSIALPFGSAIHAAVELYFRTLKNQGRIEPLEALCKRFEDCLSLDLENADVPLIYKRDMPDRDAAIEMGKAMLETFHDSVDLTDMEIVDVEMPLSATLFTDTGEATDYKLYGVLDLVLLDANGELIVVDVKTAAKAISQSTADNDGQISAYAYLVSSNRLAPATGEVLGRFLTLRKLKQPRLEQVSTIRTPFHRKRFARMANIVLSAIENGIFLPRPSWRCGDCGFQSACRDWI